MVATKRLSHGYCGAGVLYYTFYPVQLAILSLPSPVLLLARQLQYPMIGHLSFLSPKLG
jgi:hypothetical protein